MLAANIRRPRFDKGFVPVFWAALLAKPAYTLSAMSFRINPNRWMVKLQFQSGKRPVTRPFS